MFRSAPFEVIFTIIVVLLVLNFILKVIGGKGNAGGRLMNENFRWVPFPTGFCEHLSNGLIEKMKAMGSTAKPHDHVAQSASRLSRSF